MRSVESRNEIDRVAVSGNCTVSCWERGNCTYYAAVCRELHIIPQYAMVAHYAAKLCWHLVGDPILQLSQYNAVQSKAEEGQQYPMRYPAGRIRVRREARPSQCDTRVVRLNLLPSGGGLGRGKTKWRFLHVLYVEAQRIWSLSNT